MSHYGSDTDGAGEVASVLGGNQICIASDSVMLSEPRACYSLCTGPVSTNNIWELLNPRCRLSRGTHGNLSQFCVACAGFLTLSVRPLSSYVLRFADNELYPLSNNYILISIRAQTDGFFLSAPLQILGPEAELCKLGGQRKTSVTLAARLTHSLPAISDFGRHLVEGNAKKGASVQEHKSWRCGGVATQQNKRVHGSQSSPAPRGEPPAGDAAPRSLTALALHPNTRTSN
ncbi:unnamed protein product [Colias eurytheme]|nr:unnamed protein product [Colias eurytheme]